MACDASQVLRGLRSCPAGRDGAQFSIVRGFLAPTDHGWWQFLRARPEIGEVNFWRPGGGGFRALLTGEPFFFKLKAPHDATGGFGLFLRFA